MTLNAINGMLARECHQQSRLGAILNELGDVLSDIALYLPFSLLTHSSMVLVLIMASCTTMAKFCDLLAQTINGIRNFTCHTGTTWARAIKP
jgi:phosphatidylglycerophosphate synthase